MIGEGEHNKEFIKSINGQWVDEFGNLHKGAQAYGSYNIYIYKVTFKDLHMGIYSHLYAHDWTVDSCVFNHLTVAPGSSPQHFWYMMGWHLAVINSTLIEPTHDALAIRGYYPEGEVHTYISSDMPETNECYGNKYVVDRVSRSKKNGFLDKDDWTHIIYNNIFSSSSSNSSENNLAFVAIAYGIYSDDQPCGAEKTYMPPQNIVISKNRFDSRGSDKVFTNAIFVNAWQGVNNKNIASINGITITDNYFIRKDTNEKFISFKSQEDRRYNVTEEDMDKSQIENNQIKLIAQ